jgi:hypothetical protein
MVVTPLRKLAESLTFFADTGHRGFPKPAKSTAQI